jgi:hypothetical protein
MSKGDSSVARQGGKKGKRGRAAEHHHHHYYYFHPAGALPAAPHSAGQALTPLSPPPWAVPSFASAAAHPEGRHKHSGDNHNPLADNELVKGLLVGAGVGFLLTNETVQKNLIRTAVRMWNVAQGGVEEVKERFRDAEAEIKAFADKP